MMRIPRSLAVALALGVLGAGGCAGDEPAASSSVCDSYATVENTVNHIRQSNVSENGLSALGPQVSQLLDELNQLVTDAKAQFGPQADQLRTTVDQLSASVQAAQADPGRTTLAAVRTSVTAVRESARTLRTSIGDACPDL